MKLKTTQTTEVDVEINLPYFFKYGGTHHKVIAENKTVTVSDYEFSRGIMFEGRVCGLISHEKSIQISEKEFDEVFARVLESISSLQKVEAA
jgi:hypothetical protein